jgi:hypothetical protein
MHEQACCRPPARACVWAGARESGGGARLTALLSAPCLQPERVQTSERRIHEIRAMGSIADVLEIRVVDEQQEWPVARERTSAERRERVNHAALRTAELAATTGPAQLRAC